VKEKEVSFKVTFLVDIDDPETEDFLLYFEELINSELMNEEQILTEDIKVERMDIVKDHRRYDKERGYRRAVSPTGTVHYIEAHNWENGDVDPFCNYRPDIDYWRGQSWKLTKKPVTCKNCLNKMRRILKVGGK